MPQLTIINFANEHFIGREKLSNATMPYFKFTGNQVAINENFGY